MSENTWTKEAAAEALKKLLAIRRVVRVIIVDDVLVRSNDVELLNGLLKDITPEQLLKLKKWEYFKDLAEDSEVRRVQVSENWTSWPGEVRAKAHQVTIEKLRMTDPDIDDLKRIGRVKEYLPSVDCHLLSPDEWRTRRVELLRLDDPGSSVLCLFDRDLGKTDLGAEGGLRLLGEQISQRNAQVICGILSHTGRIEEEVALWRSLKETHNLQMTDFLFLSKDRLEQVGKFADGIKSISLNSLSAAVKSDLARLLKTAHERAEQEIMDLDYACIDQIIFESSNREGVSEFETLVRISKVLTEHHLPEVLAAEADAGKVFSRINEMKDLRTVYTEPALSSYDTTVVNVLRHRELYAAGEVLISMHYPTQNGDIFEMDGSSYVLLLQPCSLMVRSSGRREHNRVPRELQGILLPILPENMRIRDAEREIGHGVLPYIEPGNSSGKLVDYEAPFLIPLWILDLCVLSDSGKSVIDLGVNPICPIQLHQPWQARFAFIIQQLNALMTDSPSELRLPPYFTKERVLNGNVWDFGIRRALRYREPVASALLREFHSYLAREAKEHDFAA